MQLATLFSSRGRPRASAAAPAFSSSPALLLPLLLVPTLLLPALAAILTPRAAAHLPGSTPSAPVLAADLQALPPGFPPAFTPEVSRWAAQIMAWSAQFALPPEVIATVMQIESCGDPAAVSPAGALGLFQVMPFHFGAGEQPTEPQANARRGLSYLAHSMQLAKGDLAAGFAGYNGGHTTIQRPANEWPQETQRYARWATGIVLEVRAGALPSPTLQAWLAAGGASLCSQAASAPLSAEARWG